MRIGVIGGGPAGLFTALRLQRQGYKVILWEASAYHRPRVGEHLVAEALHEFRKCNLPEALLLDHSIPCTEVQSAWGTESLHVNESLFNPFGNGFILSRPDFDRALMRYGRDRGIQMKLSHHVTKVERIPHGWLVHSGNTETKVDFIVDASGRSSKFRLEKSSTKTRDDQLIGITRYLKGGLHSKPVSGSLLVESTPHGWWYSVLLASGNRVGTFMTDARILSQSGRSATVFWEEQLRLGRHTPTRLEGFSPVGKTIIQTAHSGRVQPSFGRDWLSVGDAGQSFDPLSSAGIVKGFRMGIFAADGIHALQQGDTSVIHRYNTVVGEQYEDYLVRKREYYRKEKRWNNLPFWYTRNAVPEFIDRFTIHPSHTIRLTGSPDPGQKDFLTRVFPAVHIPELLKALQLRTSASEVIDCYLQLTGQDKTLPPLLLHSLESLKIMGLLKLE